MAERNLNIEEYLENKKKKTTTSKQENKQLNSTTTTTTTTRKHIEQQQQRKRCSSMDCEGVFAMDGDCDEPFNLNNNNNKINLNNDYHSNRNHSNYRALNNRSNNDDDDDDEEDEVEEEEEDLYGEEEDENVFYGKNSAYDANGMRTSGVHGFKYAVSLPINVPVWNLNHDEKFDEKQEEKVNVDDCHESIAKNIKQLANSVYGDEIFGDLPRRRLNTIDLVSSRPR